MFLISFKSAVENICDSLNIDFTQYDFAVVDAIKEWISVLEASFLIFRLKPYHKNFNKRLVKNPKIFFTDTGLVCSLLGIRKKEELDYHYLKGNIFETYIINEFLKNCYNYGEPFELYFWRDNHKKEIDLIVDFGQKQYGIEIKSSQTIQEKFFSGLKYWANLTNMKSESMYLIYGGKENYQRNEMNVISWANIYNGIIKNTI